MARFRAGHSYPMTQSPFFVPHMHTVSSAISMPANPQPNDTGIEDMQVMKLQNAYSVRTSLWVDKHKKQIRLQVTGPATDRPESQAKDQG